ncbi:hypothetical protein NHQ30_000232 [Ciborinia camelliae]|nr:hypothetical protein NHQ30_000232 [Ciborinia camelliae]
MNQISDQHSSFEALRNKDCTQVFNMVKYIVENDENDGSTGYNNTISSSPPRKKKSGVAKIVAKVKETIKIAAESKATNVTKVKSAALKDKSAHYSKILPIAAIPRHRVWVGFIALLGYEAPWPYVSQGGKALAFVYYTMSSINFRSYPVLSFSRISPVGSSMARTASLTIRVMLVCSTNFGRSKKTGSAAKAAKKAVIRGCSVVVCCNFVL